MSGHGDRNAWRAVERAREVSPQWAAELTTEVPEDIARATRHPAAIESIRQGFLAHRGATRSMRPGGDADVQLLIADFWYADGLSEIAATGDLEAIRELGELIEQVSAEPDLDRAEQLWREALARLA